MVDDTAQDIPAHEDDLDEEHEPMEVIQDNAVEDSFDIEHSASDEDQEENNNDSVG
jgi:hypothetical protein